MSEDEDGPVSHARTYITVMVALAVLTLIEVQTPELANRALVVPLLMAIATAKALFVVSEYMHLRHEPTAIRLLPLAPLVLVAILLLALFFGVSPA